MFDRSLSGISNITPADEGCQLNGSCHMETTEVATMFSKTKNDEDFRSERTVRRRVHTETHNGLSEVSDPH